MTLTLDYTARLNLHALLGSQRVSLDDLRLFWKLQDRINLSDEEKKTINYRFEQVNGNMQPTWSLDVSSPIEYDLPQNEYDKLIKIVKEWQPGFLPSVDRRWLEPLLDQISGNGQPK